MSMKHFEETVKKRKSIRSYRPVPLTREDSSKLTDCIEAVSNESGLFDSEISIRLIERSSSADGEKLGTYGVIKGARAFLGVTCEKTDVALEAVGYQLEKVILYATELGLGTCWLGGTFSRSDFAAALQPKENEIFPIVSPVGYPAEKKSLTERIMRIGSKADARLPWAKLFFDGDFEHPLTVKASGKFCMPLELVRLAPSAMNAQPWRVLRTETGFHFYEVMSRTAKVGAFDMHRIDMGIAACHFDLAVSELGRAGTWTRSAEPPVAAPKQLAYRFSWVF